MAKSVNDNDYHSLTGYTRLSRIQIAVYPYSIFKEWSHARF